jgi:hypothetical protein
MLGLPEIAEREIRLGLASGNNVWFDESPYLFPIGGELGEEEARVFDVHVVAPRGQLHGEELVGRQRAHQQRGLA